MTALIASFWPYIASGAVALGAILFGWIKTKQAQTTVAQAGQKVAEAQASAAQANTQVANAQNIEAQANATAAQAGAQASKDRQDVENTIASEPSGASRSVLRDDWTKN